MKKFLTLMLKLSLSILGVLFLTGTILLQQEKSEMAARNKTVPRVKSARVSTTTPSTSIQKTIATSTPPLVKKETPPPKPKPVAVPKTETKIVSAKLPVVTPVATTTPPIAGTTPEEIILPPTLSFTEINKKVRESLVNVLCTSMRGGSFEPITGSGIMIDPRGVILTNAHVAQFLLLRDYLTTDFLECIIRTGEPARPAYKAKLLFLSPLWLSKNAKNVREDDPAGTGENDFALLLISESVNEESLPLPSQFPFTEIEFGARDFAEKNQVLVAGYPAGFLSGITIQRDLFPVSAIVSVGEIFTFGEKTADLFSIGGSAVAQKGSSGGAVVNAYGRLIGIIVTSTDTKTTGTRDLHAITMGHIARSFRISTGFGLSAMFSEENLKALSDKFNKDVASALTKLLTDALAPQ